MTDANEENTRSGFVAAIGAPNAGKSTLINHLVGAKVSIVSPKVQTTRTRVMGIAMHGASQIVFVDTPGIFKAHDKKKLEKAMVAAAWEGTVDADAVVLLVDASRGFTKDVRAIVDRLAEVAKGRKTALVLNKVDRLRPPALLDISAEMNAAFPFDATFMISALKGRGTQDLLVWLAKELPEGPYLYPEDHVTDMPMRLMAAEITREKLFHALRQELPYELTVETENWEDFDDGSVKIEQAIIVAREGHKKIILGEGGAMIGKVGQAARVELEDIMDGRVHLKLFVKVRENWMEKPEHFTLWGLDPKA